MGKKNAATVATESAERAPKTVRPISVSTLEDGKYVTQATVADYREFLAWIRTHGTAGVTYFPIKQSGPSKTIEKVERTVLR